MARPPQSTSLFVAIEADQAQRQLVFDQRRVEHAVVTLPQRVAVGHAGIDHGRGVERIQIRALGENAQRARQRARAEQRALRAAQEFDALHVEQIRVEHRGVADRGDRQLVDIDGDRVLQVRAVAVGGDTASREIVEVGRGLVEHDARRFTRQPLITDDAFAGQIVLREGSDAERHILQSFATASGGDDDFFELSRSLPRSLCRSHGWNHEQRGRRSGRQQTGRHRSPRKKRRSWCRRVVGIMLPAVARVNTHSLVCEYHVTARAGAADHTFVGVTTDDADPERPVGWKR
jgi:hypothetical protein